MGLNPFVSYQGLPHTNSGKWLNEARARGFRLVVIDPRITDAANRADLHLQVRPGHDVEILAAMLRVVVDESLFDADFVSEHVGGLSELVLAVRHFDVHDVSRRSGIQAVDLGQGGEDVRRVRPRIRVVWDRAELRRIGDARRVPFLA